MYYREPNILISLIGVIGMTLSFTALADNIPDDVNGTYFKGQMATCLTKAKVVYPCVSFSPPAYQANSAFIANLPLETNLPLGVGQQDVGSSFGNLKDLFSPESLGRDMNINADPTETGMNMNLGPMKFNMFVDENHFSDTQFFLGFDHSW